MASAEIVDLEAGSVEEGKVSRVDEYDNAYVVLVSENGADYEAGFTIHKDQYSDFPVDVEPLFSGGDTIKATGVGSPYGVRSIEVNGVTWFDYTIHQQKLIHAIRERAYQIHQLQRKLEQIS